MMFQSFFIVYWMRVAQWLTGEKPKVREPEDVEH